MTTKLTKGQREALKAIAARTGTFNSSIGDKLVAGELAYPISGILNFLVGCNTRDADGWVLTSSGAEAIGMELVAYV